jgi:hypothetical protein
VPAAEQLAARMEGRVARQFSGLVPMIGDGIRGVRFIEAAVKSSAANAAWTEI